MSEEISRPTVRLRPKAEARAIRHGFPWIYADELVTDRRTMALAAGTLAVLEDAERRPLGLVTVNPKSKITARMLDRDPGAVIGEDWFALRIGRAMALRARLHDAPFYRLVHAEADGLPGVIIDRFGDVAVIPAERGLGGRAPRAADRGTRRGDGRQGCGEERHRAVAGLGGTGGGDPCPAWQDRGAGAGDDERRDLYGGCSGRPEDRAFLRSA